MNPLEFIVWWFSETWEFYALIIVPFAACYFLSYWISNYYLRKITKRKEDEMVMVGIEIPSRRDAMKFYEIKDASDFEKCTEITIRKTGYEINCKLGLWSVQGKDIKKVRQEAESYFYKYKAGGEYSSILGGPSVIDVLKKERKGE